MKVLGVLPDPNARIVGEHPCVLLPEVRAQLLERSRRQRQLGLRLAGQSLLQGPGAVRGLGAGLAKSRLEPRQLLPGRGELLELDLAERAGRPLPVEERDRGDADLRERPASSLDAQPGRMRPRAQHRSELEARGSSRDEPAELLRGAGGAAGRLDVERRDPVADDAQPPEPLAVLDLAPQHEPGEPEPPARGVVEDLREDAPRESSSAHRGQLERVSGLELEGLARHVLIVERPAEPFSTRVEKSLSRFSPRGGWILTGPSHLPFAADSGAAVSVRSHRRRPQVGSRVHIPSSEEVS